MRQQTLAAQTGFEKYGRKTKRERFLEEMEQVVPWAELQALVEPHYPKGENGRPPVGLSIMLRVYFLQQWFNLSDPGAEDALYESPVLRHFVGIDLGRAPVPDESTILQFRHLLEKHELGGAMLNAVNQYLESRGIRITTGTIVDATIIHAPSSTKNRSGERDPEMHQTRKGKQWYFGLKSTHRSGLQARPCAFGVHVGGFGGGQAPAARPAARRGAQGVGRRWISGTGRSHPAGGWARARYDQPESAIQELCGRVTKGQEPGEGQSESEGGTPVPDSEAHLRLREGEIPWD
jgi:IS5 family transposase